MSTITIDRYSGPITGNFEYAGTWSEEHRHQCEVNELASLKSYQDVADRITLIAAKRGKDAASRIEQEVNAIRARVISGKNTTKPEGPKVSSGSLF